MYYVLVVESHPEHSHPDLRLTCPFPELEEYCDSIDLDKLDKKQHSHIPWLVIVYKFLQEYKQQVCLPYQLCRLFLAVSAASHQPDSSPYLSPASAIYAFEMVPHLIYFALYIFIM